MRNGNIKMALSIIYIIIVSWQNTIVSSKLQLEIELFGSLEVVMKLQKSGGEKKNMPQK